MNAPAIEVLARGVCVQNGHVLVCRNVKHGNIYLPGGHVDWGENSKQALAREWLEELGVPCEVRQFTGVIEQRYIARSGATCEISTHFFVDCPAIAAPAPPPSAEDRLAFEWIALDDLPASPLQPACLKHLIPAWIRGDSHSAYTAVTNDD